MNRVRIALGAALPILLAGCAETTAPLASVPSLTIPSFAMPSVPALTPEAMTKAQTVVTHPSAAVRSTKAPTKTTRTTTEAPVTAVMPDVVCMNLQDAQDKIQTTGVWYSRSKDASGRGRHQIFDRDWIVVSQVPAPGAKFGEGDAVLSVVRISEPNQC